MSLLKDSPNYRDEKKEDKSSLWFAMNLPEEITIFGVTLKRDQYLTIGGIAFLAIIAIAILVAKSWVKHEVQGYADVMAEAFE